jgi:HAD superfamily hydrolase (TIGR01490 family)
MLEHRSAQLLQGLLDSRIDHLFLGNLVAYQHARQLAELAVELSPTVGVRGATTNAQSGRSIKCMEAAFFDLDKTVIAKASMAAFRRPFRRGGLLKRRLMARVIVTHLIYLHLGADERRMARIRESALKLTKGWDRNIVRQIARDALLETVEPIIYGEALELIQRHRSLGHRVYLVSASPEELVQPLAELLGADGSIASRAEVDEEGRYTGTMAFYSSGPGKAEGVENVARLHAIDLSASTAYSDSITDLPMLEAVGHPVVVNPDRALARVARERDWPVMSFTKPVRLRNRMSPRVPALTAGVVAATAGTLVWRRARRMRIGSGQVLRDAASLGGELTGRHERARVL